MGLLLAGLLWGSMAYWKNLRMMFNGSSQILNQSSQALDACEAALLQRFDAAGSVERGEMGPAYLATFPGDRVVEWRAKARFDSHGTTSSSSWCQGDEPDGSLRVLDIKRD